MKQKSVIILLVIVAIVLMGAIFYYKSKAVIDNKDAALKSGTPVPADEPATKNQKITFITKPKDVGNKIDDFTVKNAANWGVQNIQLNPFLNPAAQGTLLVKGIKNIFGK